MTIKQIMLGLSALALSASLAPAAYAATDTGTLTVKARIGAACTLKTQNATLDFGNLTTLSDGFHFAQADITVQCSKGQAYNISLGQGLNPNTSGTNQMKSGTNFIRYVLYRDAAHKLFWGDDIINGDRRLKATGDGADQKHTIYGVLFPDRTNPPAGDYTDTVAITVAY